MFRHGKHSVKNMERYRQVIDGMMKSHADLFGHRQDVPKYDIAGIQADQPRTIKVEFRIPSMPEALAITKPQTEEFIQAGFNKRTLDIERKRIIRRYIDEAELAPWRDTRKAGNVTVHFSEVASGKERHLVNRARRLANEWKEKYAWDGAPSHVAVIDGRGVFFDSSFHPRDHFPAMVKTLDTAREVDGEGLGVFAPVIVADKKTVANIRSPQRILAIGDALHVIALDDPDFRVNVLHHERGHAMNGDTHSPSHQNRATSRLEEMTRPLPLLLDLGNSDLRTLAEKMTGGAEASGISEDCLVNTQLEMINNLSLALDTVTPALQRAAEHVESYPGFEELEDLTIAARKRGADCFINHVLKILPFNGEGSYKRVTEFEGMLDALPQDGECLALAQNVDRVQAALEALVGRHGKTLDAMVTLDCAHSQINRAMEYLADFHAVEHAEDPYSVVNMMEGLERFDAKQKHSKSVDGKTHPSHQNRKDAVLDSFAEAVLEARRQSAAGRVRG